MAVTAVKDIYSANRYDTILMLSDIYVLITNLWSPDIYTYISVIVQFALPIVGIQYI